MLGVWGGSLADRFSKRNIIFVTQALSDVQAQHRQMVRTIAGMPLVGSPGRLDGGRTDSGLPPPRLGEHTLEVLQGLGLAPDELERFKSEGVVA